MQYPPGGSPIHFTGQKVTPKKGKTRHPCTGCTATSSPNQAKAKNYNCSHCGSALKCKKQKLNELQALAKSLGYEIITA
jgi:PHP family Zn ribbon phosphoesterase